MTKVYSSIYSYPSKSIQEIEEIIDEIERKTERIRNHDTRIELAKKIRRLRIDLKDRF